MSEPYKPCPFCGAVELTVIYNTTAFVQCDKCKARGPVFGTGQEYADYVDREKAVIAWNENRRKVDE